MDNILTLSIAAFLSFLSFIGSWFLAKGRIRKDNFESIILANQQFRDEIKRDLDLAKREISDANHTITKQQAKISELSALLSKAQVQIDGLTSRLADAESSKSFYETQIAQYKEEIAKLQATIAEERLAFRKLKDEYTYLNDLLVSRGIIPITTPTNKNNDKS